MDITLTFRGTRLRLPICNMGMMSQPPNQSAVARITWRYTVPDKFLINVNYCYYQ